jgi:GT2 family glycosyltransferase
MLLGGDRYTPRTFKPFSGQVDYDWLIWIDSDQVWGPEDIAQLISNPEHKVVVGPILMYDNEHFNVSTYDEVKYDKRRWLTRDDFNMDGERFTTPECGMGFMGVQKGVFEQLEYPWFFTMPHDEEEVLWFEAEDGSFCNRVTELGIDIWVDPKIKVGHEKPRILSGIHPKGITGPA